MQAERRNSVAAGNGYRRRGKREESYKTVRQHGHDKVSFSHAGSCLYIRLPFEQAMFCPYLYSQNQLCYLTVFGKCTA
jgi:hypothetical protein